MHESEEEDEQKRPHGLQPSTENQRVMVADRKLTQLVDRVIVRRRRIDREGAHEQHGTEGAGRTGADVLHGSYRHTRRLRTNDCGCGLQVRDGDGQIERSAIERERGSGELRWTERAASVVGRAYAFGGYAEHIPIELAVVIGVVRDRNGVGTRVHVGEVANGAVLCDRGLERLERLIWLRGKCVSGGE